MRTQCVAFSRSLASAAKRYAQELRKQILETLEDGEDFDEEVNRLFKISKISCNLSLSQ